VARARDARPRALLDLARSWGVELAYTDALSGATREASAESLLAVLRALGAPLERAADARDALRARRQAAWRRALEPVSVAWHGSPIAVELRLPRRALRRARLRVALEGGGERAWTADLARHAPRRETEVEGERFAALRLALPRDLPVGYHDLSLEIGRDVHRARLIAAPPRAFVPEAARTWGVFVPLYALHSRRSWGVGDLTDLGELSGWLRGLGGSVVATLPLLAAFLDRPCEPSPYAPASRLFWSELYLDPERVTGYPGAWPRNSPAVRAEIAALSAGSEVDPARAMALKRRTLEELARRYFGREPRGDALFRRWLASEPRARDYARFRATCERRREPWQAWPARLREGRLARGDFDEPAMLYHLFVQWQLARQVGELAAAARGTGSGLYLDLPLGVHPDGYDTWRERAVFASGASGGAPPDAFFTRGQDWGFPPLHPEASREQGHRYRIEVLRASMRHAGILRIDHVLGLHRLFWVPRGLDAREGAYVRYPSEELYAITCLESQRSSTLVVGEDLGTVPPEVRPAMARRGLQRMYVLPFELADGEREPMRPVPRDSQATLGTHDMAPFAAFLAKLDLADQRALGLVDDEGARNARERRDRELALLLDWLAREGWTRGQPSGLEVLHGLYAWLGASPARVVVASLEDLWGETLPQNTPGTTSERCNWRRRARHALEELRRMEAVRAPLQALDRWRRQEQG
jgi:4-alpha-glucanotransferase